VLRISSSLLLLSVIRQADEAWRQVLPSQRCKNAISYAIRQDLWPLIDCLVTDAHSFSSGSFSASQQFNGFGLEHVELNHSSISKTTAVQSDFETMQPWLN
jgi:hypothetical protein